MVDFDNLRRKAEGFVEQHEDQIDKGIDKAADVGGQAVRSPGRDRQGCATSSQDLTHDGRDTVDPDDAPPGKARSQRVTK